MGQDLAVNDRAPGYAVGVGGGMKPSDSAPGARKGNLMNWLDRRALLNGAVGGVIAVVLMGLLSELAEACGADAPPAKEGR